MCVCVCVCVCVQASDLRYLMQQYEHWANSMYPKLTFKDVTDRIERLATKKEFKVHVFVYVVAYLYTRICSSFTYYIVHALTGVYIHV